MNDLIDAAARLFTLVGQSTTSVVLSVIGLLLLLGATVAIVSALKGDPAKFPGWLKVVLFITLIFGIGFSVAGPSLVLVRFTENAIPKLSSEVAFDRLGKNAFTKWLVRLIAYDPARSELSESRPNMLGLDWQTFTFVAPYEELRGLTATDAVASVGGKVADRHRLWAVIFQLPTEEDTVLYPANARGLLQVIRKIENDPQLKIEKPFLKGTDKLDASDDRELNHTELATWKYENFKTHYPKYCALALEFQCDKDKKFSAKHYLGEMSADWHPLGFSKTEKVDPCDRPVEEFCGNPDWAVWKQSLLSKFGSRAFLARNMKVEALPKPYLIDFVEPGNQVIPDIGVR